MSQPQINVTPLIDVLLVLLIIFMVVSPLRPAAFKARVPSEPSGIDNTAENPKSLVVMVGTGLSLRLNSEPASGTVNDTQPLVSRLRAVFDQRAANGDVSESYSDASDRPMSDRIERTVFIKAPRRLDYGSVVKVVDAVRSAGAFPISLQIDRLD